MCHSLQHSVEVFLDFEDIDYAQSNPVACLNLQNGKSKLIAIEFMVVLHVWSAVSPYHRNPGRPN